MEKTIIELLPKNKEEEEEFLKAKILADAVESGIYSDEFFIMMGKDLGFEDIEERVKKTKKNK